MSRRLPGAPEPETSSVGEGAGSVFEALALPQLPALYRLAVRLTGRPQDAEDLVQETYIKALRAFSSLRDPARVRPWLTQILTRLVIDRFRTPERELAVGDLAELDRFSLYDRIWDEDPLPYSDHLHRDFLAQFPDEDVRHALLALPEVYRVPLVLLYGEDLSYRELADLLACPWERSCRGSIGAGRSWSGICGSVPSDAGS
jgi:RNA polymerase sigma-70 factor, ECF subfamily